MGAASETILRIIDAHPMYGTDAFWRHLIGMYRAGSTPATAGAGNDRGRTEAAPTGGQLRLVVDYPVMPSVRLDRPEST